MICKSNEPRRRMVEKSALLEEPLVPLNGGFSAVGLVVAWVVGWGCVWVVVWVVFLVVAAVTHTRSEVAVGATVWTWFTPQVLSGEQTRSDVAVGATLSYWYTVQAQVH
jgi:hypothetical protein